MTYLDYVCRIYIPHLEELRRAQIREEVEINSALKSFPLKSRVRQKRAD